MFCPDIPRNSVDSIVNDYPDKATMCSLRNLQWCVGLLHKDSQQRSRAIDPRSIYIYLLILNVIARVLELCIKEQVFLQSHGG